MREKKFFTQSIEIERISPEGCGVGLFQKTPESPSAKALIPGSVPGDVVLAEMGPKQKGVYRGRLLQVERPSQDREVLRCAHAPLCGGCSLQPLAYPKQLAHKEQVIRQLFASLVQEEVHPILPSREIWQYRNKMEYTFSQDREGCRFLGLIRAGSKGRVESLSECHLAPSWFIDVLHAVRQWWEKSSLLAYNRLRNTGSLRTLTLREGRHTQEKMAILTVSGVPEFALRKEEMQGFASAVQEVLQGQKVSLFLRIQQTGEGRATQFFEIQLGGPAHIEEELEIVAEDYRRRYRFKVSPTAFFQPNTLQAEVIYSQALMLGGRNPKRLVLDLYAGTATLGMIFAPFAEKVIAIEQNPYAVFDAEMNKELNEVDNLSLFQGDVAEVLERLNQQGFFEKVPDLVILDPPRTGLSAEALRLLIGLGPEEIVYISCAPATQARDCHVLQEAGYSLVHVQPIDQFPHTVHVENIVLLRKKP